MVDGRQRAVVLVVEDEPVILNLVQLMLEDAGFDTLAAGGAAQALALLYAHDRTAVVGMVTDINLGAQGSGWELARRARQLNPDLPVVYMSGGNTHEWPSHGVPRSIMVPKPFSPSQIVVAIATLANRSDPRR